MSERCSRAGRRFPSTAQAQFRHRLGGAFGERLRSCGATDGAAAEQPPQSPEAEEGPAAALPHAAQTRQGGGRAAAVPLPPTVVVGWRRGPRLLSRATEWRAANCAGAPPPLTRQIPSAGFSNSESNAHSAARLPAAGKFSSSDSVRSPPAGLAVCVREARTHATARSSRRHRPACV